MVPVGDLLAKLYMLSITVSQFRLLHFFVVVEKKKKYKNLEFGMSYTSQLP